ncbi:MAG: DUF1987 family protein [Ekhidna sp.]|nr:DUF1987 family protein [Ekhidna sp.]
MLLNINPNVKVVPPSATTRRKSGNLKVQYHDLLNLMILGGEANGNWPYSFKKMKAILKRHFHSHEELNVLFRIREVDSKSKRGLMKVIRRMNQEYAKGKKIKVFWSIKLDKRLRELGQAIARICRFPLVITSS